MSRILPSDTCKIYKQGCRIRYNDCILVSKCQKIDAGTSADIRHYHLYKIHSHATAHKLSSHCLFQVAGISGEASPTFGHANANFSVFIGRIRNQFLKKRIMIMI